MYEEPSAGYIRELRKAISVSQILSPIYSLIPPTNTHTRTFKDFCHEWTFSPRFGLLVAVWDRVAID